mgnify:CR=1 FL=1
MWNRIPSRARSLNFTTAFDQRHRSDGPCAGGDRNGSRTLTSRVIRASTRSSTRARSLETDRLCLKPDDRVGSDDEFFEVRLG